MLRFIRLLLAISLVACAGDDTGAPDAAPAFDAAPACAPTAGGPYWLTEGETVTITATCATGIPGLPLAITPLPAGAAWDPATATLTWTPGLDQAATWILDVSGGDETATVKIGVADRWDDPANVPIVEAARYTEEYGLPVFHLTTDPGINGDDYTPAQVIYRGHAYAGTAAKYRGMVSMYYPKKSFTVEFTREDKFSDPLVGFVEKRKLVLNTTFDDNSYLRQRLVYELWNRLDPTHHIRVQHFSAIVFLNGAYHGIYEVLDHVDEYLMEDHGLRQEGNLYKAINHDANFRLLDYDGEPKQTLHDGYEKKEGLPIEGQMGAFADIEDLTRFVATASPADFANQIETLIDRKDFEDWWLLVSLLQAADSVGKNSYLYHDPLGGPFRYVPWDFNHSLGQTWETEREPPDADPEAYDWWNEVFTRFLADPVFGPALRARYPETLAGPWREEDVLAVFDGMAAEIAAAAPREEARWGAEYAAWWGFRGDLTTHDEEVAYVRQWIVQRWAFARARY